jgi:hypothetical protein
MSRYNYDEAKPMRRKDMNPACAAKAERGGQSTRERAIRGVGRRERMKRVVKYNG